MITYVIIECNEDSHGFCYETISVRSTPTEAVEKMCEILYTDYNNDENTVFNKYNPKTDKWRLYFLEDDLSKARNIGWKNFLHSGRYSHTLHIDRVNLMALIKLFMSTTISSGITSTYNLFIINTNGVK
jgi:hypothetical protein